MTENLNRLKPASAASYLVRTGWTRMGERNAGTVWTRQFDDGVRHLFLPEDPTRADHALCMGAMLTALALAEGRSALAVLAEMCVAEPAAGTPAEEKATAERTDWVAPEYGLRRPELALVLDLAAGRVDREAFVRELQRLSWPRSQADELADLVWELLAGSYPCLRAGSAPTPGKAEARSDGLG